MSFSFGFSGDDIEHDVDESLTQIPAITSQTQAPASYSAFPVAGKPQIPATRHALSDFLSQLPSKLAYDLLDIDVADDGASETRLRLPRRELWDVRVQLMAEDDEVVDGEDRVDDGGLGKHDVKTGIYEGGFKSWESSIDLVKVLAARDELTAAQQASSLRVIEDPVLQDAFSIEGELELSPSIVQAFEQFLSSSGIDLSFISGAWSPEFISCLYDLPAFSTGLPAPTTLMVGAETIYSPFALQAFTQTIFTILEQERGSGATAAAYVAAKRLYFGVGGSLDDFIEAARSKGATVSELREESEGVRRGVVHCILQQQS
ncbi:hypothetical protein TrVFT333_005790 [Trichoderma virens FT-333]|nr:hypothetical protein TrVFT333_005790 [Trichoderma virens FT-333]